VRRAELVHVRRDEAAVLRHARHQRHGLHHLVEVFGIELLRKQRAIGREALEKARVEGFDEGHRIVDGAPCLGNQLGIHIAPLQKILSLELGTGL